MASRIMFLGTGGDSFVVGKQLRAAGGIVIKSDDVQLHIDPGPGALLRAGENNVNLRENTAVLVSNNNVMRCNDVNAVIDAMTYSGLDNKGILVASKSIVNGNESTTPFLTKKHNSFLEKIIVMQPGQKLGIEDVEIHAAPSASDDPNGIGFIIITNDFILGYPSDTKYSKHIAKQYEGCDILILNVLTSGNEAEGSNLCSEDAVKFIQEVKPRLVVITGFGIKMIRADILMEARSIEKQSGSKVIAAKEGMSITPESYSAESRQKRLNMFRERSAAAETNSAESKATASKEAKEKTETIIISDLEESQQNEEKQEHLG
jgi:ribonuclease BN (tRNA processing enzyme)